MDERVMDERVMDERVVDGFVVLWDVWGWVEGGGWTLG